MTPVGAIPLDRAERIGGVELRIGGQEVPAPAAHDDLHAVHVRAREARLQKGLERHQLAGDVGAASLDGVRRHVRDVLPVAIGRDGVGGGRRGVGDARGADHAGGHAAELGQLQRADQLVERHAAALATLDPFADVDDARIGLHAGHHRRHGAGRVRGLRIDVVGARQTGVGHRLERQHVLLAALAAILPIEDARRGLGADAHAVTDEQDDVARRPAPGADRGHRGGAGGTRLRPAVAAGVIQRIEVGDRLGTAAVAAAAATGTRTRATGTAAPRRATRSGGVAAAVSTGTGIVDPAPSPFPVVTPPSLQPASSAQSTA